MGYTWGHSAVELREADSWYLVGVLVPADAMSDSNGEVGYGFMYVKVIKPVHI